MNQKIYALVGNWRSREDVNGLVLCEYDEKNGSIKPLSTWFENISVGNTFVDSRRGIVYFVDERVTRSGNKSYGGGALAAKLDMEKKTLELLSEVDSLSTNPSFICVDKSGKYALVPHHGSRNCVSRVVRDENGNYAAAKQFDDIVLVLFRLGENGELGSPCDIFTAPGDGKRCPHLHSLYADPSGELFISCDKGTDRIYSFRLDREAGKLVHLSTVETDYDTWPRYAAFHPAKPYLYTNSENSSLLYVWRYDVRTGVLEKLQSVDLFQGKNTKRAMPSDIVISPDGASLYVSVRGTEEIVVLNVGDDGLVTPAQIISCQGSNPRGLALSPDGRFLLSANLDSGKVATFEIRSDGKLVYTDIQCPLPSPGNIAFLVCDQ